MRSVLQTTRRRGTVLLLVVSLLAMLFVIVTGFLALARFDEQTARDLSTGNDKDVVVDNVLETVKARIVESMEDADGNLMGGPGTAWSTIAGEGTKTYWLASLNPVWRRGDLPAWPPQVNSGARFSWGRLSGDWIQRLPQIERFVYPAVSSIFPHGSSTGARRAISPSRSVLHLMPELPFDGNALFTDDDVIEAARIGWMDADGDGIPDSDLLLSGQLIELANALVGTPVRVPRPTQLANDPALAPEAIGTGNTFRIHSIFDSAGRFAPDDDVANRIATEESFRRYLDNRSLDVAFRVVAHGGMLSLDAAQVYDDFTGAYVDPRQRRFVVDMFDAIRNPLDVNELDNLSDLQEDEFFDELAANAPGIEVNLRNRGFLPNVLDSDGSSRVPGILSIMQGDLNVRTWQENVVFPETMVSSLTETGFGINNSTQARPGDSDFEVRQRLGARINVADVDDESGVVASMYALSGGASNAQTDRRHQLTTVSYSDNLARKQTRGEPIGDLMATPPVTPVPLSLYRGEQKFYLGEVLNAFNSIGTGSYIFAGDYQLGVTTDAPDTFDNTPGDLIIANLARFYGEMLFAYGHGTAFDGSSGSGGWDNVFVPGAANDDQQAVSPSQQAYMLAVNTVAFAAPRSVDGWIPTVRYSTPTGITYTGYGPQPFISEVIAARETTDMSGASGVTLAVELYNPQTPLYAAGGPVDQHALNGDQFAIRILDDASNLVAGPTPLTAGLIGAYPLNSGRFPGRSFATFVFDEPGVNNPFGQPVIGNLAGLVGGTVDLRVQVVRYSRNASGVSNLSPNVVDEVGVIQVPNNTGNQGDYYWNSWSRDTTPSYQFNVYNAGSAAGTPPTLDYGGEGAALEIPRWNLVTCGEIAPGGPAPVGVVTQLGTQGPASPGGTSLNNSAYRDSTGTLANPDLGVASFPFGPTTPLPTMNAEPFVDFSPFGGTDFRPRSFPTVGFMHFIPRFSHVSGTATVPMSRALAQQWDRLGHTLFNGGTSGIGLPLPGYPCDFAHMPVFDNNIYDMDVEPGVFPDHPDFPRTTAVAPMTVSTTVPWGQLVYDYFTTIDPDAPGLDPLRIASRIDINSASPLILSNLPMMGPNTGNGFLPMAIGTFDYREASADFWWPLVGVVAGDYNDWEDGTVRFRMDMQDATGFATSAPGFAGVASNGATRYRPGEALGYAFASYRDAMQHVLATTGFGWLADAHATQVAPTPSNPFNFQAATGGDVPSYMQDTPSYRALGSSVYGPLRYGRGPEPGLAPTQYIPARPRGFVTVGELLSVKGMDGTRFRTPGARLPNGSGAAGAQVTGFGPYLTRLTIGDYIGAVSMMAMLDSQQLTTRSNTFTVYTSIMERTPGREDSSIRAQVTLDRSNLLPRLEYVYVDPVAGTSSPNRTAGAVRVPQTVTLPGATGPTPVRVEATTREPLVIAEKRGGYFNSRYDN